MEKWQLKELEKLDIPDIKNIKRMLKEKMTQDDKNLSNWVSVLLPVWGIFHKIDNSEK